MGLTSNGGVHSSFDHCSNFAISLKNMALKYIIHCFMDGRDTDPKSGKGFIEQLTAHCENQPVKSLLSLVASMLWIVTSVGNV